MLSVCFPPRPSPIFLEMIFAYFVFSILRNILWTQRCLSPGFSKDHVCRSPFSKAGLKYQASAAASLWLKHRGACSFHHQRTFSHRQPMAEKRLSSWDYNAVFQEDNGMLITLSELPNIPCISVTRVSSSGVNSYYLCVVFHKNWLHLTEVGVEEMELTQR